MFSTLENNFKVDIAPLLQLVKLMPTDAPPVKTGVQGREKGDGSSNYPDQGKVVSKVIHIQIPTSLPKPMSKLQP